MLSIKLICSLFCLVSWAAAVPEMDCYRHGLEVVQYNHREKFMINLAAGSSSRNLRNYECTCNGYSEGCDRLDCRIVSPEEANDNDYETVSMSEDEEEEQPTISIEEPIVIDDTLHITPVLSEEDKFNAALESEYNDMCTDDETGEMYHRGTVFVKEGTPSKGCKCPSQGGAIIQCVELSCQMMTAIQQPIPRNMDYRNCFDHWMNKVYPNGARYTRTRQMSQYQSLNGNYSCSCDFGMTKCTATDIPCCDAETGEFRGKGQSVAIDYRGTKMSCTCFGGRSSFRNCQFRRTPVMSVPLVTQRTPTSLAGGNSSGGRHSGSTPSRAPKCLDPVTRQRYLEGETWTRVDSNGEKKRCRCRRSQRFNYLQSICKIINY